MSTIDLVSTPALAGALGRDLLPFVARSRGLRVSSDFITTTALRERIAGGTVPDVLIALDPTLRELSTAGLLAATTRWPLATCGIGIAVAPHVRAVAPTTVTEFVELLMRASSVAYSRFGASGLYVARVLVELGIAEHVASRATVMDSGFAAEALLDGRAEVALQLAPELLMVEGTSVLGLLPAAVQQEVRMSVVTPRRGESRAAELAEVLLAPEADEAYRRWGLTPLAHSPVDLADDEVARD